MNYKINLLKNKNNIAIWGTGYIGLSTMMYFAKKGVSSVGFDVDSKKVRQINKGILPINELKDWFGFDIKPVSTKIDGISGDFNTKNAACSTFFLWRR